MRGYMRRFAFFLALLFPLGLCSGCLAAVEIEEYGYVQSFGIARGEEKKYAYSFLLQYYAAAGEGSATTDGGVIIAVEGDTIFEAVAAATAGLPYELSFARTASVFISEELAREEGITQLLSLSFSALKLRYSIKIMIVKGDPYVFQQGLQVKNSPDLLQMQRSIMFSYHTEGTVPNMNYAMFYEALRTGRYDATLQYGGIDTEILKESQGQSGGSGDAGGSEPGKTNAQNGGAKEEEKQKEEESSQEGAKRSGGMAAYAEGTALFDGVRMVGTLNAEETKYLLMGRGDLGKANISFSRANGQMLTIELRQIHAPAVSIELGDAPKAHTSITLRCRILYDNRDNAEEEWEKGLREELALHIQNALQGVFISCRDMNSDAFGFGRNASMLFSSSQRWREYAWKEKYGGMEASFSVMLQLQDVQVQTGAE